LYIRNLTILFFLASCSVTTINSDNISFDDSFSNLEKYELKKCLKSVTEEINFKDLSFTFAAENINSQGLEFNTKYVGKLILELPNQNKEMPFMAMRMQTTNYISSNMADEEKKRLKTLIISDICNKVINHAK